MPAAQWRREGPMYASLANTGYTRAARPCLPPRTTTTTTTLSRLLSISQKSILTFCTYVMYATKVCSSTVGCIIVKFADTLSISSVPSLPPLPQVMMQMQPMIKGVIQFPINDVHEELIKPFVIRERGEMIIPRNDQKYCFPLHHHQLSLVSLSISEINVDDEDEDEDDDIGSSCDACTMPIFQKKKHQSSSSSPDYEYMSCGECKYFLHLTCFNLPPELPSHPPHKADHKLILEACPKLEFFTWCSLCYYYSNGLLYSCTKCDFKADIKCASLPTTIKHGAHPHHHLNFKFVPKKEDAEYVRQGLCGGCSSFIWHGMLYKCGSCDFILCRDCALLPPVNKHKLEKHPLPLRYDARINRPGDFYRDGCEGEMDPREWMYHCRDCDTSFHRSCFPATSGEYRNVKFGQQYNVRADLHAHPLTFRLLTTKLRCDVCRFTVYGNDDADQRGFHCSSCNFFMCLDRCFQWRKREIFAID